MFFMIYFQLILIICILIVFCVFHNKINRSIQEKIEIVFTNFRLLLIIKIIWYLVKMVWIYYQFFSLFFKNVFGFNIYIFFLQYSNLFLYICRNDLGHKIKILIYKKKLTEINDYFERISKYKKLYATFNIHI